MVCCCAIISTCQIPFNTHYRCFSFQRNSHRLGQLRKSFKDNIWLSNDSHGSWGNTLLRNFQPYTRVTSISQWLKPVSSVSSLFCDGTPLIPKALKADCSLRLSTSFVFVVRLLSSANQFPTLSLSLLLDIYRVGMFCRWAYQKQPNTKTDGCWIASHPNDHCSRRRSLSTTGRHRRSLVTSRTITIATSRIVLIWAAPEFSRIVLSALNKWIVWTVVDSVAWWALI